MASRNIVRTACYILLLLLLASSPLFAQEVPLPDLVDEQAFEPEVTIREGRSGRIEEYRVGGWRYMVKITPTRGYSYYLIDTDGDGSLETRRDELSNPETIQWRVWTW